ncbi:MAG TPA: RsmE family RNA methyltransferase [Phycisphaerae bacterium]|nr:RsmE family RNA methyltransferase [Phycisphaerae bacterium]
MAFAGGRLDNGSMTPRRFLVDDLSPAVIRVVGEQARHALRSLRLTEGAEVHLFDGRGGEAVARITRQGTGEFEATVTDRMETPKPIGPSLVLAVAMPKGPRGDWLVEKCAELGVSRLIPLSCARSQVEPGEGKLDRWRRKAVEAAKQSRQSSAMMVEPTTRLAKLLESHRRPTRVYYGAPYQSARSFAQELQAGDGSADATSPLLVIIGPEGGLSDEESGELEAAGAKGVTLSPTILRIETAAVAFAAVWACWVSTRS